MKKEKRKNEIFKSLELSNYPNENFLLEKTYLVRIR